MYNAHSNLINTKLVGKYSIVQLAVKESSSVCFGTMEFEKSDQIINRDGGSKETPPDHLRPRDNVLGCDPNGVVGSSGTSSCNMKASNQDLEQPSGGVAPESELEMQDIPLGGVDAEKVDEKRMKKRTKTVPKMLFLALVVALGALGVFFLGQEGDPVSSGPVVINADAGSSGAVVITNSSITGQNKDQGRDADNSRGKESRIIGGYESSQGDYPYYVKVLGCGGTLIAPNVVLTAAHCPSNIGRKVRVGAYKRFHHPDENPNAIEALVIDEIDHPTYGYPERSSHDLKLLLLAEDVVIQGSAVTLTLDDSRNGPFPGTQLTVMGLGRTENTDFPFTLREVDLPVVGQFRCDNLYKGFDDSSHFCAGTKTEAVCNGDSGGPFVRKDSENRHVLVGAVSGGGEKCKHYSIFASVTHELWWIRSVVCDQSSWNPKASFCSTTDDDEKFPRGTTKLVIEPLAGAGCRGRLELRYDYNKSGKHFGCDAITASNHSAYEMVVRTDAKYFEMFYNGHSDSCWRSKRGFYIEGKLDDDVLTPPDKCIQLRRKSKSFWKCKNRNSYHFNVRGYYKDTSGKVSILDINIKDNGVRSCDGL
ncbi:unnamed protein product [Cylindrotheca closterium]|uniref:Peptidase S1 domain-containing protein n=1 Tax=Cylindrotheca closterium TaxID=2856 RepID=A0AAD2CPS2_9STRA|nr:unnamed protein product [Cylindrotheca closterium]